MNKIISLIKIDFNNTFGLSSISYNFKKKKNRWTFIVFAIAFLSLAPSYVLMMKPLGHLYHAYEQLGQRTYFLQIGIFLSQVLVFVLGILYVMSKYYFANDLSILVPLPIKSSHILGSKFVTLMVSEYLTSLPIILPFILMYGIKGNEGILYWLYSTLLVLSIPVLPLIISSILVMVFMKYTNIKGKKDAIRIIGTTIFIFIMVYFQLKMQNIIQKGLMDGGDFFLKLANDSDFLVKRLGLIFPPSMWGTLSLSNYKNLAGLSYLLLLLVISIIGYIIMIFLSERLFFDGLIGNMEVSTSKRKGKKDIDIKDNIKVTKPYMAIARKEVIMLYKTPVYLLNSIGGVIIIPIIMVVSVVTGNESLAPLKNLIEHYPSYIVLAAIGMITILGVLNSIGSTTFSREGKNFWIQRVLPIRVEDQIIGRIISSLLIQILGVISILVSLLFIVKISIANMVIIIVLGLLGSIPMTEIGMIIDIIRPLLVWDNPQKAMKQNLNVLISMGLGVLYGGLLGFTTIKVIDKINILYIYLILGCIFIVSAIGFFLILRKLIKKQFADL